MEYKTVSPLSSEALYCMSQLFHTFSAGTPDQHKLTVLKFVTAPEEVK